MVHGQWVPISEPSDEALNDAVRCLFPGEPGQLYVVYRAETIYHVDHYGRWFQLVRKEVLP